MKRFVALAAASALGLAGAVVHAQDHNHQQGEPASGMPGGMHMDQMPSMPHMNGMGMMDHATAEERYAAVGKVTSVKKGGETASITIDHEPVPELKWPAMTMAFNVASPDLLKDVRKGDAVAFQFKKGDKGSWIITQLKKAGD